MYLSEGAREAIVVDRKYGELDRLCSAVKSRIWNGREYDKNRVLSTVYDVVDKAFYRKSNTAVNQLLTSRGFGPDEKVPLDDFIRYGTGVCRHMALACAALLEILNNEGIVSGSASVDRNSTFQGGHGWCRYVNSFGIVSILDITLGFKGTLAESVQQGRWPYTRPEDRV